MWFEYITCAFGDYFFHRKYVFFWVCFFELVIKVMKLFERNFGIFIFNTFRFVFRGEYCNLRTRRRRGIMWDLFLSFVCERWRWVDWKFLYFFSISELKPIANCFFSTFIKVKYKIKKSLEKKRWRSRETLAGLFENLTFIKFIELKCHDFQ